MEQSNKLIYGITLVAIFMFIFISSVSATDVIDSNGDPFANQTNTTNSTNQTVDSNNTIASYLEGVEDETLRKLIEELIEAKQLNQEEREYLKAILESSAEERRQYQEALAKLDYAYKNALDDRDAAVSDKTEFITTTKTRMETLETEVESIRLENTKLKAWAFFYIILGLAVGILTLELAGYLKKNQKSYFVIRWIRDKIPIKF